MSIEISDCRICGSSKFEELFDLGEQPLANALVYPQLPGQLNVTEKKYPLVLVQCKDCEHIQLKHTVTPEEMFVDYHFHTASSPRMVSHFANILRQRLPNSGLVVEIGSNDGSVLEVVQNMNGDAGRLRKYLGIDPSKNLCEEAATRGVATHCAFFGKKTAEDVVGLYGQAKLILCANVLGHVPDLNDFVAGLKTLLADSGKLIIEVPHVVELYKRLALETIYHEHVSYFSITVLVALLNKHGLFVECIEPQEVHGGTLRVHVRATGGNSDSVSADIYREALTELAWSTFRNKVTNKKQKLRDFLDGCDEHGLSVVGYGAAAKAAVLLNYYEIKDTDIKFVVDNTLDKQGKLMPGTHQKVISPEKLYEMSQQCPGPDSVLILAWNHAQEIVNKEAPRYPQTKWYTPDLIEVKPV